MVAPKQTKPVPRSHIDVAIIGGGVVGVIAAKRMLERGIAFTVIEKQRDFGGVWHTHGNNHSTLQVFRKTLLQLKYAFIELETVHIFADCASLYAARQDNRHQPSIALVQHAPLYCQAVKMVYEGIQCCRHRSFLTGSIPSIAWANRAPWNRSQGISY